MDPFPPYFRETDTKQALRPPTPLLFSRFASLFNLEAFAFFQISLESEISLELGQI